MAWNDEPECKHYLNSLDRYSGIRAFVEKRHGIRFVDFMSDRRGKCTLKENKLSTWDADEQDLLLSDFNLMGAYLW